MGADDWAADWGVMGLETLQAGSERLMSVCVPQSTAAQSTAAQVAHDLLSTVWSWACVPGSTQSHTHHHHHDHASHPTTNNKMMLSARITLCDSRYRTLSYIFSNIQCHAYSKSCYVPTCFRLQAHLLDPLIASKDTQCKLID